MLLKSINPYTNELLETFQEYKTGDVIQSIEDSAVLFNHWKSTTFAERRMLMTKAAELLRNGMDQYARTITLEMGKPIIEAQKEVEKCAWVCDYYVQESENFLKSETIRTDAELSYVCYEPLGVILGIMPWNFPFWQVFRFAVPTLMAGNTILLKHASNVQGCARHIENIFKEANFPKNVFKNLVIGSNKVGPVIRHPAVRAVSLTGSETAGRKVAETASRNIKKTVLELGGNNAFVVLADADIEKAVNTGLVARMQNAGQSCIAAKRFILHKKITDPFVSLLLERMRALKTGDPLDPGTDIGPLASIQQAETVRDQVNQSVAMGAKIIAGGKQNNAFYEPTLMVDVLPGMPVFDEEVFGPVIPIILANNTDEAIKFTNRSTFGLGVSVFTRDIEMAKKLVGEYGDGAVFINALVKSDPRLPFGGTRNSGYGRELSVHGIREFVNVKTVYVGA